MIVFPHAKINLGLHVKARRDDGYHEIETVLCPIQWCDALEGIPGSAFHVQRSTETAWSVDDDIVTQTMNLVRQEGNPPGTLVSLHKTIPVGAGLGGGSSDAAHTLILLNALHNLNLSEVRLHHLASILGADCPFFLYHRPMLASGTGTELRAIDLALSGLWLMVVVPEERIETRWAYAHVTPRQAERPLLETIMQPVAQWRGHLVNDLEVPVVRAQPVIGQLKQRLYDNGAVYASMTGSGSAVFGLFEQKPGVGGFDNPVQVHVERLRV